MLKRYTALKRSSKPIARVSARRRRQNADYTVGRLEYLQEHPFCQIAIALAGADEAKVIADHGRWQRQDIPRATHIHHRNKARGIRKNDRRFWMSASAYYHGQIEGNKRQARLDGFLLPLEADADGRLPDGTQCLTTEEFMADRARKPNGYEVRTVTWKEV